MYSSYTSLYQPLLTSAQTTSTKYLLTPPQSSEKKETKKSWTKDPKRWGPHLWQYMHYAAANYPEKPTHKDVDEMVAWLNALPVTIPCPSCEKHYRAHIEKNRTKLYDICSSKQSLFNFLVDIHNKVNKLNNKPIMSYDEAWKIYQ